MKLFFCTLCGSAFRTERDIQTHGSRVHQKNQYKKWKIGDPLPFLWSAICSLKGRGWNGVVSRGTDYYFCRCPHNHVSVLDAEMCAAEVCQQLNKVLL